MIFKGIDNEKAKILEKLKNRLSFKFDCEISFEKSDCFKVEKKGEALKVCYKNDSQLYRSLLLCAQLISDGKDGEIAENEQFESAGVMLDCSRAGVMNVEKVKEYMEYMALMGLNSLLLYMEDTYKVEGYDYFGYMRGSYSKEELKEIDAYGLKCGIEVIPCIQTLAHLEQYIKWSEGKRMSDTPNVLMIGSDAAYKFIDKIIATVSECFTTRRIHIGMDEAWGMGTGAYLAENGYKKTLDIFCDHITKVKEITDKYNLKPMIWSDMYFRTCSKNDKYYDDDIVVESYVRDLIPDDVTLVYWDYYHQTEGKYESMITKHKELTDRVAFAGGIWLWRGLVPDYFYTFQTTNPALKICKEQGIKDVFATVWGDDGCETDQMFSLVGCALYGEHAYNKDIDNDLLKKRVKLLFNADLDDFMALSNVLYPLEMQSYEEPTYSVFIKQILFNDIMCGLVDAEMLDDRLVPIYQKLYNKYDKLAKTDCYFKKHYEYIADICKTAWHKVEVTQKLHKGYKEDKELLFEVKDKLLPQLEKDFTELKNIHYSLWHSTFRPFGFEVIDGRYGVKLSRISSAILRISDYLDGKIPSLPELEEERLKFNKNALYNARHSAIMSAYVQKGW